MRPLLSIIIPVFNVEKYIGECFDSIKRQKMKEEVEIICVNDGSTDRSGFICDEYAKIDKRFKIFHQKNKGVSSARNLGIKMSKGKYIAWIDPDDYISDNWWDNIKNILENDKKVDIIFFDYIILKDKKYIKKTFANKSSYISKKDFLYNLSGNQKIQGQLWQKIFKKELLKQYTFPENISFLEDYAMLSRFVLKAENIYYLSKKLYVYRLREHSITKDVSIEKVYMSYLIVKEVYDYLQKNNFEVSRIGYLIQALKVCISYYKTNNNDRKNFIDKFDICRNLIDKNILYVLISKDCNFINKFKFLLYKCNLISLGLYLKKFCGRFISLL